MLSDEGFYSNFRNWILSLDEKVEEEKKETEEEHKKGEENNVDDTAHEELQRKSLRVSFLLHQVEVIPTQTRDFYCNMMRSYPTSPIYLLLGIGSLGTNIARYSGVRRLSAHVTNVIRTGCFYKFLAPSRYCKGIAMALIADLGGHVEKVRSIEHKRYVAQKQVDVRNNNAALENIKLQCLIERPNLIFLTGGNVRETWATAAANGGCGLITVNEIKTGKSRYTEPDGSYGTLGEFYDPELGGRSFRKADNIPRIDKCRIQMIAAGVKEDWVTFITKSGRHSGMLGRIIPVLAYDKPMVGLAYGRLPQYAFPLNGLKKVLSIMETNFQHCSCSDDLPSLTLQFSASKLDETYRATNELLVAGFEENGETDYRGYYRTLLDNGPPAPKELRLEGSGCGQLSVYLEQVLAEFTPLVKCVADETVLRYLEDNVLRIASDFYWAFKLPSYLSKKGVLTAAKELELRTDLNKMIEDKVVTIPREIIPQLLSLITYILKGIFHLNKLAHGRVVDPPKKFPATRASRKRNRIVWHLSRGSGRAKRRRFFMSKLDQALAKIGTEDLEQQVRILKAHSIVVAPTHRSVALEKEFSEAAMKYLRESCEYDDHALAELEQANGDLHD